MLPKSDNNFWKTVFTLSHWNSSIKLNPWARTIFHSDLSKTPWSTCQLLSTPQFPPVVLLLLGNTLQSPLCLKGEIKLTPFTNVRYPCYQCSRKSLKKIVASQLTTFLESENILVINQHGFRSKLSTQTALTMIKSKYLFLTLCDLSKAFESVNHPLPFKKLRKINIDTHWLVRHPPH